AGIGCFRRKRRRLRARRPRRHDGAAGALHQRRRYSVDGPPRLGRHRAAGPARPRWRRRNRQVPEDGQRLLRALGGGGRDGRIHFERQKEDPPLRRVPRRRIRHPRSFRRRAGETRRAWHRKDLPDQAHPRGASGAPEERRRRQRTGGCDAAEAGIAFTNFSLVPVPASVFSSPLSRCFSQVRLAQHTVDNQAVGPVTLWFLPALALTIAVHEAGHLLAGCLLGFRFLSVSIGPAVLRRWGRCFRLRFERGLPAGAVGVASVNTHNLRTRLLIFTAGGPVASILLIVAGFSFPPQAADGHLHVGLCI